MTLPASVIVNSGLKLKLIFTIVPASKLVVPMISPEAPLSRSRVTLIGEAVP